MKRHPPIRFDPPEWASGYHCWILNVHEGGGVVQVQVLCDGSRGLRLARLIRRAVHAASFAKHRPQKRGRR